MTVNLTKNFLFNARGIILKDSATCTWSINLNTNEITATAAGGGGGGLTSVGFADTSSTPIYTVSNSPLVANGTLDITLNNQSANTVFAGPTTGSAAQPTFRALVAADLPAGTTPLGANPTGTVGPTATNGSATTFLRSDGAPAINLTATYTWTGVHTFTHAGVALEVKGDTALFDVQNTAGADVIQIGTVKAVLGSGTNVTDAALLSIAAMSFFTNSSATLQMQLTTSGLTVGAAPTGGGKGTGTINVSGGYYVNGTALAASPLTTKGDLYGHSTVDARIAVGANGTHLVADSTAALGVSWQAQGAPPTSTPGNVSGSGLMLWFQADLEAVPANQNLPRLFNYGLPGYNLTAFGTTGGSGTATTLNSKPVLALGGTVNSAIYASGPSPSNSAGMLLGGVNGCTIFFVGSASSHAAINGIVGTGASNGVEFSIQTTGAMIFVNSGTAILGTSSGTVAINTAFQTNVTYSGATGNIAFRISQAASGTAAAATHPLGSVSGVIFGENTTTGAFPGYCAELIIFARVLSGAEILAVEAYLNTKWGV